MHLEVASLDDATFEQAEPTLRRIVERGLRTSGMTTWNGAPLPYVLRLTPYDNAAACAAEPTRDEEPREIGPQPADAWGPSIPFPADDSLAQGYVGDYFAHAPDLYLRPEGEALPRGPWPDTFRLERWKAHIVIEIQRNAADLAYLEALEAKDVRLDALVQRTTCKYGPD